VLRAVIGFSGAGIGHLLTENHDGRLAAGPVTLAPPHHGGQQ
jgi:hypothetical protein